MQFDLYDIAVAGIPIASLTIPNVSVANGTFTVALDFGATAFNGEARWLEILVAGTPLTPRQALTAAPHALALTGLYTRENVTSPSVIGGFPGNNVTSGAVGATIGSGGVSGNTNRVTDHYGTVGGGRNNQAGDAALSTLNRQIATVGGGNSNTASGTGATVSGGDSNTASGDFSAVGGGDSNAASGTKSVSGI
jgi:hypothetical protein